MKKELIQFGKVAVLGAILAAGAALAWVAPGGPQTGAPAGNVSGPLNSSISVQAKLGDLTLGSSNAPGASLDVYGTTQVTGLLISLGQVGIAGKLSVGPAGSVNTPSSWTSELDVTDDILSAPLAQTLNPSVSYNAPLCATTAGEIILCP